MKNTKTKLAVAICCLGSLAAANVGRAGLTQLGIGYYSDFGESVRQGATTHNTYGTAFSATYLGGTPLPLSHSNPFITFCLTINANLSSPNGWSDGGFNGPAAADPNRQTDSLYRAANLYNHYAPGIMPASGWATASTAQKLEGAALQLAIWEVLYEDSTFGYNVLTSQSATTGLQVLSTGGNNDTINARANVMLGLWSGIDYNLQTTFWNAVDANGNPIANQDLIGPISGTSIVVPEPSTMIAGALLLLPFGASTLRILRKNRAA